MIDDRNRDALAGKEAIPPPETSRIDALIEAVSAGSERSSIPSQQQASLQTPSIVAVAGRVPSSRFFRPVNARWVVPSLLAFVAGLTAIVWSLWPVDRQPTQVQAPGVPEAAQVSNSDLLPSRSLASSPDSLNPPIAVSRSPLITSRDVGALTDVSTPAVVETRNSPQSVLASASVPVDRLPVLPTAVIRVSPNAAVSADPVPIAPVPSVELPLPRAEAEEDVVRRTLDQYADAYDQMNVGAAMRVWPSADRRALARAFATLKSQTVAFQSCQVNSAETTAVARCRGTVQFVRKFGSPTPRTEHQEWLFNLRKVDGAWKIEHVIASQISRSAADQPRISQRQRY